MAVATMRAGSITEQAAGLKTKGFTLIEVVVALVILGLVLGGLYSEIQSQIDRRYQLQERYLGQTAAWNRLLEQYQLIEKWTPAGDSLGEKNGDTRIYGRDWYWELDVQETLGEDFYRYEVKTYSSKDSNTSAASLAAYFVAE